MRILCLVFLLIAATASCHGPTNNQHNYIRKEIPIKETILTDLKRPWSIAFLNENEALITEKDGNLLKVNLLDKSRKIITGFPADLADSLTIDHNNLRPGEFSPRLPNGFKEKFNAGIFEVLLDPLFEENHFIYISYVSMNSQGFTTKIIKATFEDDRLTNIQDLFVAKPYTMGMYHFGGGMVFGPDGKLYITIGERLFSESLEPAVPVAQNVSDRRGKIYRLNSDGTVPSDNPDFGSDAVPGLYATGIRAAQGLTLNKVTGKIWFTEHGTTQGDEINVLEAGANYGWPVKTTGKYRGPGYAPPKMDGHAFSNPKWYWLQTVAPTGLTFYYGDEFLGWKGDLLISGLSRGSLWRVRHDRNEVKSIEELLVDDRTRTRKVSLSPAGKIYLLTDEPKGRLIRVKNAAL